MKTQGLFTSLVRSSHISLAFVCFARRPLRGRAVCDASPTLLHPAAACPPLGESEPLWDNATTTASPRDAAAGACYDGLSVDAATMAASTLALLDAQLAHLRIALIPAALAHARAARAAAQRLLHAPVAAATAAAEPQHSGPFLKRLLRHIRGCCANFS